MPFIYLGNHFLSSGKELLWVAFVGWLDGMLVGAYYYVLYCKLHMTMCLNTIYGKLHVFFKETVCLSKPRKIGRRKEDHSGDTHMLKHFQDFFISEPFNHSIACFHFNEFFYNLESSRLVNLAQLYISSFL